MRSQVCSLLVLVVLSAASAFSHAQEVAAPAGERAAPPLASADETGWSNLQQLRVGQKIEVVDTNLKKLKGTFLSFSDEAISLRVGKDEVGVRRGDILRVSLRGKPKRWQSALAGFAIGAGAGLLAGFATDNCGGGTQVTGVFILVTCMPIGAGIGAGVGAAIPFVPSYRTIYRAK